MGALTGLNDGPGSPSVVVAPPVSSGLMAIVDDGACRIDAMAPAICCTASDGKVPMTDVNTVLEELGTVPEVAGGKRGGPFSSRFPSSVIWVELYRAKSELLIQNYPKVYCIPTKIPVYRVCCACVTAYIGLLLMCNGIARG